MTGLAVPFDDKDVHGCQSPSPGSIYIEEKSIETPTAARDLFDFHGDNSSQEARHYGADNQQTGQEFPSRKPESNKHNQHHASTKKFSSFCSTHVQNNPNSFQYQAPLATASAVDIPMSWVGGNTSAPHPGEKPKRPLSGESFPLDRKYRSFMSATRNLTERPASTLQLIISSSSLKGNALSMANTKTMTTSESTRLKMLPRLHWCSNERQRRTSRKRKEVIVRLTEKLVLEI